MVVGILIAVADNVEESFVDGTGALFKPGPVYSYNTVGNPSRRVVHTAFWCSCWTEFNS